MEKRLSGGNQVAIKTSWKAELKVFTNSDNIMLY
jgi:hypothetical protein